MNYMKKLKKLIYTLAGGLLLMGVNSCDTEEFLTIDQYSLLPTDMIFNSPEHAKQGLVACYTMMLPYDQTINGVAQADPDWGIKPNLFIGGHPTMDTQATGWDKDWNSQSWTPGNPELLTGWKHAYKAISRSNDYLAGLAKSDTINTIPIPLKRSLDGQARGIRAFYYMWLAKAFGRVPMLAKILIILLLKPVQKTTKKCGTLLLKT
jgi:hypothetical protein